ncbi:MAG: hypothetical protein Fur0010_25420 [Bdellovibrio sp.]
MVTELKQISITAELFRLPPGNEAKKYSKKIDRALGFKIPQVEQGLLKKYKAYYKLDESGKNKKHFSGTQTWIGLSPDVLQTPYNEILEFLGLFLNNRPSKVVDLGAGYGRMGIVINALYPEALFEGYEIIEERIDEARRIFDLHGLHNCSMFQDNILDPQFEIPEADIFFIYDFSEPRDLMSIMKKLLAKQSRKSFFIITKGEGLKSLIQSHFPELLSGKGYYQRKEWSIFKLPH